MNRITLVVLVSTTIISAGESPPGWLPAEAAPSQKSSHSRFLDSLSGTLRPLVCQYDGAKLAAATPLVDGSVAMAGARWTSEMRATAAGGGALNLAVSFKLTDGAAAAAGVALALDFAAWDPDNYVFAPAMIYGGNRFRILPLGYPPFIRNEKNRPLDMPVTTTNIPHLNPDGSHAIIELNSGNLATPMLGFLNPRTKRGFILLAEQGSRFGNNGLLIEEDAGPGVAHLRATFVVSAPGVRSQRYVMCGRGASPDKGADWKAGDELTLKFRLYNFPAADLAAFFAKVFEVRKALSGDNTFACITPFSAAADLILQHFDKDKWYHGRSHSYYCNKPGGDSPFSHQIGWSGLPVYASPALLAETPERLKRVELSLDALTAAQGRSGLFVAMCRNGEVFGDAFDQAPELRQVVMTRRTGEAITFGLKQLGLLKQRGHPVKPEWEKMFRNAADALVKLYTRYGQFGQFANAASGDMVINGSTAGGINITALAIASSYFHEPKYLKTAEQAARYYHDRDLARGYVGGGPAEILQAPDSEASYNLVEAYVTLYEATGKKEWLAYATEATHYFSTWMMSYDYQFPEGSEMERAGTRAAGGIFASSQNNHCAPGLYISSGDFLLKLFRATSDPRIAAIYRDTAHNVVQYIGAPHNPLRKESGCVTERVQVSDWEGNDIGSVNHGDSNMAWETLAALTCLENPGIYLHTDDDTLLVLDHVEAKVLSRDKQGVTLSIRNPTPYDAEVSIFAESAKQAATPLGWGTADKWPRSHVKSGETKTVRVSIEGKIIP